MKKKTKRNPQDSTRRNTQAANKRLDKLEKDVKYLMVHLYLLQSQAPTVAIPVKFPRKKKK